SYDGGRGGRRAGVLRSRGGRDRSPNSARPPTDAHRNDKSAMNGNHHMSARTESNLQLDWALYYHQLGWSVVPTHIITDQGCSCENKTKCISPGKHPAITWKAYQSERATEDQIRNWFSGAYRGYGVGIITGRASSGLFVVDVDEAP